MFHVTLIKCAFLVVFSLIKFDFSITIYLQQEPDKKSVLKKIPILLVFEI